jgi:hypothetical protein
MDCTMKQSSPRQPASPAAPEERGDWFFDELMTPQPDATQAFLRSRLEALQKDAQAAAAGKSKLDDEPHAD